MRTDQLPGLPVVNDEPVFDEPWQARAFAIVVQLHERGCIDWQEWSDALSSHIALSENDGGIADRTDYYCAWVSAIENLVAKKLQA